MCNLTGGEVAVILATFIFVIMIVVMLICN